MHSHSLSSDVKCICHKELDNFSLTRLHIFGPTWTTSTCSAAPLSHIISHLYMNVDVKNCRDSILFRALSAMSWLALTKQNQKAQRSVREIAWNRYTVYGIYTAKELQMTVIDGHGHSAASFSISCKIALNRRSRGTQKRRLCWIYINMYYVICEGCSKFFLLQTAKKYFNCGALCWIVSRNFW